MVTGTGTAHLHPFNRQFFQAKMQYACPDEDGKIRGLLIEPLHPKVPMVAQKDELLYKLLASIDILRAGKVGEQKMAVDEF